LQGIAEEIFLPMLKSNKEELPVLISAVRKQIDDKYVCIYTGIVVYNRKKFEEELIAARKSAEAALNENVTLAETKLELRRHIELLDGQRRQVEKQHEELRQFTYVVSHHLQEPVRKVKMFTSVLEQRNKDADCAAAINKITIGTEQMKQVLSDLQQYLWLQESLPNKSILDLNVLIDEAARKLGNEFPDVKLQVVKDALTNIEGDPEQLELLFYHLLSNAIRFRKEPSAAFVTISATALKLNKFRFSEGKYKYSDFLRIYVKDQGIGYDGAFNDRPFEIFRRLHYESGKGMGLTVCKKIIDNHFGQIKIEAEPGQGATVTIELPLQV
jgi:sigma-B regulation protein RsbU (phosphoserine phosphatase)